MLEIQKNSAKVAAGKVLEIQNNIAEGTQLVMQALSTFTGASSDVLKMNKADPRAAPEMAAAPLSAGPDEPAEPAAFRSLGAAADAAPAFRSLGAASPGMEGPSFCSLGGGDEDGGSAAGDGGSAAGDGGSAAGDCGDDDGGGGGGGGTDEPEP